MKKLSLQEQLLQAGLVNEAKLKTARSEKHKQTLKQRKNNVTVEEDAKLQAQKAKAEQAERDRLLNLERNKQTEQKQRLEQVRQLIIENKLERQPEEQAYRFTDGNKVKTLWLPDEMRHKIIAGKLAIVRLGNSYEVVTLTIAEKVRERDAATVVVWFDNEVKASTDDEYQGYEIPDDLIW